MYFLESGIKGANDRFPDVDGIDFFDNSDFLKNCNGVIIKDKIANGAFGVVYNGEMNGKKCAIKIEKFSDDAEEQTNLLVELTILQSLPHERLVHFYGAGVETNNNEDKVMIIMELCTNGALRECLEHNLKWNLKIRIALDIAQGLVFLHEQGIIHRDIKTTNVLLDDLWRGKLCDFSFAIHDTSKLKCDLTYGTEEFMSPEIALAQNFDFSTDIFSFGIVLCEIITGKVPSVDFLHRKPRDSFSLNEQEVKDSILADCPEGLEALALMCCEFEPSKRPIAQTCVDELEILLNEYGGSDNIIVPINIPDSPNANPIIDRRKFFINNSPNRRRLSLSDITMVHLNPESRIDYLETKVHDLGLENKRLFQIVNDLTQNQIKNEQQIAKLLKICINYYDNNDDDKDDGEHENIIHNKSDSLEVVNKNSDVIIDDDNKEENNKNINDSNDDVNNDQDNIDNIVTESHIEILHTALGNFLNIIEKVQEKSNCNQEEISNLIVPWFNKVTSTTDDNNNSLSLDTCKSSNDNDGENKKKNVIPDSPLSLSTPKMTRRN